MLALGEELEEGLSKGGGARARCRAWRSRRHASAWRTRRSSEGAAARPWLTLRVRSAVHVAVWVSVGAALPTTRPARGATTAFCRTEARDSIANGRSVDACRSEPAEGRRKSAGVAHGARWVRARSKRTRRAEHAVGRRQSHRQADQQRRRHAPAYFWRSRNVHGKRDKVRQHTVSLAHKYFYGTT